MKRGILAVLVCLTVFVAGAENLRIGFVVINGQVIPVWSGEANASPGTYGDSTHVAQVTVNPNGQVTSAAAVAISGAAPTGAAGGDLAGTYPNPTLAVNRVPTTRNVNTTAPLTGGGALSADLTLALPKADATHDGYLAQGDWSTFNGKGSGSVTSVGLSLPAIFSVGGTPVTTSGTLSATLANATANTMFTGPSSGSAAAPTFRAMVGADIPSGTVANSSLANSTISVTDGAGIGMSGSPVALGGTLTLSATTAMPQFSGLGIGRAAVAAQIILESDTLAASVISNGMVLSNSTAATASVLQFSPALSLSGAGWDTTGATNVTGYWQIYDATASGSSGGLGRSQHGLNFDLTTRGSKTSPMTLTGAGALTVLSGVTANGSISASPSSNIGFSGRSQIGSPVDSDLIFKNGAANAFNRLIFGPVANTWPTLYAITNASGAILSQSGLLAATNGFYFMQGTNTAPTAATIGGTVGSVTNHVMKNVNGLLIAYWSDGTTLWSKTLAP